MAATEITYDAILKSDVLCMSLLAAGVGVIGGLARVARLATDEATKPRVKVWFVVSSLFVAAVAAIAAFYVLTPETPLKFIAACVLAGYSGPALLDSVEAKMRVLLAETKAAAATSVGERAVDAAQKAIDAAKIAMPSAAPAGVTDPLDELAKKVRGLQQELAAVKSR